MSRNKTIRMAMGGILLAVSLAAGITVYDLEKDKSTAKETMAVQNTDTNDKDTQIIPDTTDSQNTENENIASDTAQITQDKENTTVETTTNDVVAQRDNEDATKSTADNQTKETTATVQQLFTEDSVISWPVEGTILLDYSMDETTYFSTLNVYKCNPAVLIKAEYDEAVHAAYGGTVKDIFTSAETGDTIVVDMGNGYEATYGQLKDISVSKGDTIQKNEEIGKVCEPTKYYRNEGTNLYFGMTKNDQPVDPAMYTASLTE